MKILTFTLSVLFFQTSYAQLWESLDGGFDPNFSGNVDALYPTDDTLFIGGSFTQTTDGEIYPLIVAFANDEFIPLGCGLEWDCDPESNILTRRVNSIIQYHDTLIAGGTFEMANGEDVNYVAFWNGIQWQQMGQGFSNGLSHFAIHEDTLYACNPMEGFSGEVFNGLSKWNGSAWIAAYDLPLFGSSINTVHTIQWYNDEVYIGGNWEAEEWSENLRDLVRWNGEEWSSVGNGLFGSFSNVRKLVIFQDDLIVAGGFSQEQHPDNPGNFIAAWDGENWDDMAGGLRWPGQPGAILQVNDVWADDTFLYVVGVFAQAGEVHTDFLARWDGEEWCGFGSEPIYNGADYWDNIPRSVCVWNNQLIVGGAFTAIGEDENLNGIARFMGEDTCLFTTVQEINSSVDYNVYPNPIEEWFSINSTTLQTGKRTRLRVVDTCGRLIQEQEFLYYPEIRFSRQSWPSGIYVVEVEQDGMFFRNRVVVR